MKITLKYSKSRYNCCHRVEVDDKPLVTVRDLCECPEDAMIGRSLVDGEDIIGYMTLAFEAGKAGQNLEVVRTEAEDEDD